MYVFLGGFSRGLGRQRGNLKFKRYSWETGIVTAQNSTTKLGEYPSHFGTLTAEAVGKSCLKRVHLQSTRFEYYPQLTKLDIMMCHGTPHGCHAWCHAWLTTFITCPFLSLLLSFTTMVFGDTMGVWDRTGASTGAENRGVAGKQLPAADCRYRPA